MNNIIDLPNGSQWDNDLAFRDQAQLAQLYFFETLKIVMQGIVTKTLPTDVLMLSALDQNVPRELMCFDALERDNLILKVDKAYRHKDWAKVLNEDYVIPDADFFNISNWIVESDIRFSIETKTV